MDAHATRALLHKFENVLHLIFDKTHAFDGTYYDVLLNLFTKKNDEDVLYTLKSPCFSDMIICAVTNIDLLDNRARVFVWELLSVLTENDTQFDKVEKAGLLLSFYQAFVTNNRNSIRMETAFIKMATNLIKHYSGVQWLKHYKIWLAIVHKDIHKKSHIIKEASFSFVSKLIWKFDEMGDETYMMEVLHYILNPLCGEFLNFSDLNSETEDRLDNLLLTPLKSLSHLLKDAENVEHNRIIQLLNSYFLMDSFLFSVLDTMRDEEILKLCSLCWFKFDVFKCKVLSESSTVLSLETPLIYYNVLSILATRRSMSAIFNFTAECIRFWHNYGSRVLPTTFEANGRKLNIEYQFLIILMTPVAIFTRDIKDLGEESYYVIYLKKIYDITNEHVLAACYNIRELLRSRNSIQDSINALNTLLSLGKYFERHQGEIIYQTLYYLLDVFLETDNEGNLKLASLDKDKEKLISLTFAVIKMVLVQHDLKWQNNYEILCLHNTLINFLKGNFLSLKVTIQALELLDIGIKKFLPPDLTLLIEKENGGTTKELASVLMKGINHEEWEIRDSTFQILVTCTEISYIEYPPFQKMLIDNNFLSAAANTALHDNESYVRVTALKCVAAGCKIDSAWKCLMRQQPQVVIQLGKLLKSNTDDMVKAEIVNVLTEIYKNQKCNDHFRNWNYELMQHTLADADKELKTAILKFWESVIKTNLANRGMQDGKFPTVIFCHEKRKIISLNPKEIRRILLTLITMYSKIGCLNALLESLADCFLGVQNKAYEISKELFELMERYEVYDETLEEIEPITDPDLDMTEHRPIVEDNLNSCNQEEIINDITNTTQYELLCNVMERHKESTDTENVNIVMSFTIVKPSEFLRNLKDYDYLLNINNKREWLSKESDLNSVLDEILESK